MTSNCGFPEGAPHPHVDACYRAGRRDATEPVRSLARVAEDAGRTIRPEDVLALLDAPLPMGLGSCLTTRGCTRGYQHREACDA